MLGRPKRHPLVRVGEQHLPVPPRQLLHGDNLGVRAKQPLHHDTAAHVSVTYKVHGRRVGQAPAAEAAHEVLNAHPVRVVLLQRVHVHHVPEGRVGTLPEGVHNTAVGQGRLHKGQLRLLCQRQGVSNGNAGTAKLLVRRQDNKVPLRAPRGLPSAGLLLQADCLLLAGLIQLKQVLQPCRLLVSLLVGQDVSGHLVPRYGSSPCAGIHPEQGRRRGLGLPQLRGLRFVGPGPAVQLVQLQLTFRMLLQRGACARLYISMDVAAFEHS
mmetsp:Transcript_8856/g.25935  ORF Transcript_8856/g.25935 Transcript_8856/m.25935 type:complete len:268 (+) Transcript_8856:576-1379(+)